MNTDSDDILATGTATASQLGKLFRRDKANMPRLLQGVAPVAKRKGFDVYDIAEAATMLVKPGYEIEAVLKRMNKADLPNALANDFWSSQRSRIKFEEENGNLWATDDVVAMVSAMLAVVSIQMKLLVDNVERQAGLTPAQRQAIQRISEGAVNGCREAITDRFSAWPVPVDNVSVEVGEL